MNAEEYKEFRKEYERIKEELDAGKQMLGYIDIMRKIYAENEKEILEQQKEPFKSIEVSSESALNVFVFCGNTQTGMIYRNIESRDIIHVLCSDNINFEKENNIIYYDYYDAFDGLLSDENFEELRNKYLMILGNQSSLNLVLNNLSEEHLEHGFIRVNKKTK